MPATTKRTGTYEAMFLMAVQHTSAHETSLNLCKGVIEKHGGSILVIKKWDERKLAYEIGKAKRGLYVIAHFNMPKSEIASFERDVKLSEDFLRILVTDASHLSVEEMAAIEPQPIAPPAPERPSWDMPPAGDAPRAPRPPRRREDAGAAAEAAAGKD